MGLRHVAPALRMLWRRLAAAGIATAVLAAPCAAAGVAVGGDVAAGFGLLDVEADRTRSLDGIGEAALFVTGTTPAVRAAVELSVADDPEAIDDAEHEVVWLPAAGLSVSISGAAFEIESMESNASVVNAPEGPVGDDEAILDASGNGLLNVEYGAEVLTVGLALSDACVPDCGYALGAGDPEVLHPDAEEQSAILHLRGSAGDLAFNAYAAASSGRFAEAGREGRGAGGGLGLHYEPGAFAFALDAAYALVRCVPEAGDLPCSDDERRRSAGAALWLGGFAVHHFRGREALGDDATTTASTDVVYLVVMDEAAVGPEYRTRTDRFLLFGMSVAF